MACCGFSPDGSKFALVEENTRLKIFSVASGTLTATYHAPKHVTGYTCLAWIALSKGLSQIALGTDAGLVVVWDVQRGVIVSELGLRGSGHTARVRCIAAAAGRLLTVADDRQCIVWCAFFFFPLFFQLFAGMW